MQKFGVEPKHFHTWVCVWNVLHAPRWRYRTQKLRKNRHLRTIAQLCLAISSPLRHVPTVGKNDKQQHLLHMSSLYGKLWLTNGWDRLASLGHPCNFQRVSRLGFVTVPTSLNGGQPNFARCLAVCWAGIRLLYIHFRGLLSPNGILPGAKFTLRPSLAFSCFGSVNARHSSSGRQPTFAAWCNYGTSLLIIFRGRHLYSEGGHRVGHRPIFYVKIPMLHYVTRKSKSPE